jgi:hypothetical protein
VLHLHLYVASELRAREEKAATAMGVAASPWLSHVVRRVTLRDSPTGWREATPRARSHDSPTPAERCMLRLSHTAWLKLQELAGRFDAPKAGVIRHLLARATPEDCPPNRHLRAGRRCPTVPAARHEAPPDARPIPRGRSCCRARPERCSATDEDAQKDGCRRARLEAALALRAQGEEQLGGAGTVTETSPLGLC